MPLANTLYPVLAINHGSWQLEEDSDLRRWWHHSAWNVPPGGGRVRCRRSLEQVGVALSGMTEVVSW